LGGVIITFVDVEQLSGGAFLQVRECADVFYFTGEDVLNMQKAAQRSAARQCGAAFDGLIGFTSLKLLRFYIKNH
jgi:hypothetical protein